jgi:hypothetical protein
MLDHGVTFGQLHRRILLASSTVGLLVTAALPWWEFHGRVTSGWGLLVRTGDEPIAGSQAVPEAIIGYLTLAVMITVLVAVMIPPDLGTSAVGLVAGSAAAIEGTVLLFVLLSTGNDNSDLKVSAGLWLSVMLCGGLSTLWLQSRQDPWPQREDRGTAASA